jgi:hypothetical protein
MATEGHKPAGRKGPKLMNTAEMDKNPRWVNEWPMKVPKVKWPVRELMVKRQQRLLKRWLRYAKDLKAKEDKIICYCWPETGRSLDDNDDEWDKLGSTDDLQYCRLGRKEEIPVCQEGNESGSVEDLKDCCENSQGISNDQLGQRTELRSDEDLMDCE